MRLLAAGVPLSLLLDLASPAGPDSVAIAMAERGGHDGSEGAREGWFGMAATGQSA